jgi:hypothetical protein
MSAELADILRRLRNLETAARLGFDSTAEHTLNAFGQAPQTVYSDLTWPSPPGVGPTVDVDVPESGRLLVTASCQCGLRTAPPSIDSMNGWMAVVATGSNVGPVLTTNTMLEGAGTAVVRTMTPISATRVLIGLQPGPTTLTMKYWTTAFGTDLSTAFADYESRSLTVIPL